MEMNIFKSKEFLESDKKLPFVIGKDDNDNLIIEDLCEVNNLLVLGQIGTPRVPFIHSLICGLSLKCSANDVKMLLIDFKRIELERYANLPHTKFTLPNFEVNGTISNDYDKCLYALDRLAKESVYRYHKIKEAGSRNIEEYNKFSKEKIPYIVCVVEYSHVIKKKDVQIVEDFINLITKYSQEVGICFIYTLNRLTNCNEDNEKYNVLTENMLKNFSSKVVFKLQDNNVILNDLKIEDDEEFRKHWFIKQNDCAKKQETLYVGDEEIKNIIKNI